MSKEHFEDLHKKYLDAESNLQEEDELFNAKVNNHSIKAWSDYVKQKKKKAPADLKETVWKAIENKKKRKQRFLYGISGVAASIILIVALSINTSNNKNISYEEKEALLNEALSMVSDDKQTLPEQNIIYEDEMIIIYKTRK